MVKAKAFFLVCSGILMLATAAAAQDDAGPIIMQDPDLYREDLPPTVEPDEDPLAPKEIRRQIDAFLKLDPGMSQLKAVQEAYKCTDVDAYRILHRCLQYYSSPAFQEDVRDTAARALTIIADAGGLAAVIESEVDTHVRCRAVEKYGELYEGESTLEPLTNALKDKEPSVRESSVKSLGTIRAQDAKALLKAMVRDADEYNSVREAAADALRQIAGRRPKVRKKGAKGPARMGFGCGGCLVVFLAALLVFALLGMLVAKKEEPNRSAIAQAKEDSRVVAVLGKPVTDRLWVAMGTEREGLHSGAKSYRVALSGPKGGAILKLIIMDGEDGRELLSAVVTPTSTGKEIHLVGTPEAQGQGAVDKQERTK